MSWWTYVADASGTESPKEMSARTGIDGPNFSRWKAGHVPKVDLVAKFARAYRRPVLEAFIAAGFLTEDEAKVRPAAAPDYSQLSNDKLLELVRSRMQDEGGGEGDAGSTPQTSPPAPDPADQSGQVDPAAVVDRYLIEAKGDPATAVSTLTHDGPEGAGVDEFTFVAALRELRARGQYADAARDVGKSAVQKRRDKQDEAGTENQAPRGDDWNPA